MENRLFREAYVGDTGGSPENNTDKLADKINPDNEPVLAIFDKEGTLIRAGKPPTDLKGKREVGEYAAEGYTLRSMTIKEFRESNIKLYAKKDR